MQIDWIKSNKNCFNISNKHIIDGNENCKGFYYGIRLLQTYNNGRFYYEVTFNNITDYVLLGVCTENQDINVITRYGDFFYFIGIDTLGEYINKGSYSNFINKITNNDTIGICLDFNNKQIGIIVNREYKVIKAKLNNDNWYPCFWLKEYTDKITINFGDRKFKYKIPNGYSSFCLPSKFLLEQNNQLYTIKSEFYEPSKLQYKPITGIEVNNITDEHLKKYGFDDVGDILKTIDKENMIMERDDDLGSGIQFRCKLHRRIKKINNIEIE